MAENTKIEWATHTFNPWIGCTKVSPGCDNCYAEAMATRFGRVQWGAGAPRSMTAAGNWHLPVKWNAEAEKTGIRPRVFCASMADVFDNEVPEAWRERLFDLIAATPHLDWLLLTKRIGNVKKMMPKWMPNKFANIWLGITVVNQQEADRDISKLLEFPARVRFLSMEPLLGPVDLLKISWPDIPGHRVDVLRAGYWDKKMGFVNHSDMPGKIDWVIAGGESGNLARPMQLEWARGLRDQCREAAVPFFFKQWGEWHPAAKDWDDGTTEFGFVLHDPGIKDKLKGGNFMVKNEAGHQFARLGKKISGRLLDGKTHNALPGCATAVPGV